VKSIFRQGVCSARLRAVAVVVLCLAGLLCASPAAQAGTYYWDILPGTIGVGNGVIDGGNGTWGTGNGNWTNDGGANNTNWVNARNDTAVFSVIGGTVSMNSVTAGGITFDNPSAIGYTIQNANTLSLGGGGVIQTLASDGTHVNKITSKIVLTGATATFSSNSANSTMEIGSNTSGSLVGSSTVNTVLTLNGSNTGKNVLGYATNQGSTTIINNGTGKTLAIVKDGPGTWWISGKNLSTGGLTVKAGTLVHSDKDNALGNGSVTLGDSAGGANDATVLSGFSGYTISRPITLAPNTTGILTLGGGTGIAETTYSGGVLGSNNLTLASNGTLLTMKTATINNTGTLTVKGAGNTDITSVIGGNVTSLTKNDGGILTLSNTNTYAGATVVNAGRLQLNGLAAGTLSTSGLTVGAGATVGFTVGTMDTLNLAGTFTLGGGTVAFDIGTTTYDALTVGNFTLSANSFFTINAIPTLALDTPYTLLTSAGAITNTGPYIITVPGAGGKLVYATTIGTNDVTFTASMSEGEWNQAGSGNWSVGNPGGPSAPNWNNYKPTVAGDAALFGSAITAPATIAVDTPHTVGYMRFHNDANAYTIGAAGNSNLTLDNGASAAAITVTSGSHIIAENILLNSNLNVAAASGTTLTVSGNLSGNFGVEKKDAGELVLSGTNNSYTGATKVSAGTLSVNGSLTGGGAITVNAGTLSLNGSITGGAIAVNGSAVLSESATGSISGAASITHSSTGTSILSGANSYTGDTTVSAGLLKLNDPNALPGGVGAAGGTSKLVFNGGVIGLTSNFSRGIGTGVDKVLWNSGGGGFAAFGADRSVNFGGAGAWVNWTSGGVNGTLYLSHSTATHTVTVANSFDFTGGTKTVSVADGAADVDAVLSGYLHNGGLTKNGLGTLVLTGAYYAYITKEFNTRVEAGTLSIGGAGWLAYTNNSGTVYIATGATLDHNSSAAQTLSGVISGGGVITKTGAGTLTLTNANTYTGKTTVSAGTLSFNTIQDAGSATASALGKPAVGADSIIDLGNTGTLKYTGAGNSSDRVVNLTALTGGAMTLNASGASGTFALTGGVTSAVTSGTSTLTLTGTGLGSESAAIVDGTGTNVTALTKSGTGTWTLSGANTYTGATTVSAGTLDLGGGTATGSLLSTTLNLGGTFAYTRNDPNNSPIQAFTTTNLSGLPAISVALGNTLNLGTIAIAGGTIDFAGTGAGTVAALPTSNINGIIPGATFGDTWAVANGAGVAISGLAAYTLTSDAVNDADNYTAANIDANSSQTPDAAITPYSLRFNTAGAYTLTLQGTNVITAGGILVGSTVGANLSTITGGTLAGAASDSLVVTQNNTGGGLTIGSDIVDNTGATGLIKFGAGLFTLTGANTYTGVTALRGGILSVSSLANANSPSNIGQYATAGAAGLLLGGTLQYTGGSTVVDRGFTLNANSTVDVNSAGTALGLGACSLGAFTLNVTGGAGSSLGLGAVTLTGAATLNPTTASLTVASVAGAFNLTLDGTAVGNSVTGVIGTGAGTLTKSNTGDWTLSGANTYTGATTISGGTLTLGPGGRLNAGNYAGAISIASGAFLTYANPSAAQTLSGAITGAGTLSQSSSNDLILSGAGNSFSNLTISGGRVFINTNAGALPSGATTTISNQGILDFGVGATYSGTITVQNGGGIATRVAAGTTLSNVTLPGSGTVVFNNDDARTYLLTISSTQAISTGGTLTVQVGGGRVGTNPIGAVTLSGDISGSGSLAKTGDGTLNLSGANTYTGATTVSAGVLTISQPYLDDASTVTISILGGLNLAFADSSVIDLVGDLWLGETHATPGTPYNSGNSGGYISGTGNIKVASVPGDTNSDNVVDAADFITLKKNFGRTDAPKAQNGNFTIGDTTVNWADLSILMSNMGVPGGAPSVPEPCSAMLLIFGAAALLRRRRKA
jgi:autotransporter-associated beta strand protein